MHSAVRPASPLPPATCFQAAKKLAKLAAPTCTSSHHKVLLTSKSMKPSPAVKPKAALAALKGKAPTTSPVPVVASGPSVPPMNAVAICGGVVGMTAADAKEDIAGTVTRLDHNQLRLGAAVIELKDAIAAKDNNTDIRDNALVTQMTDVRKYLSKVRAAQVSATDAPALDDLHTLGENLTAFIQATDGRFTSFQSVLNAIASRITASSPSTTAVPIHSAQVPATFVLDEQLASAPAGNMVVDPGPFFTLNPTAHAENAYSSMPFVQYPPASGPIRGQPNNCLVLEDAAGVNFRDVPDVKRLTSTSMPVLLQHLRAEFFTEPHRPNDRPTMEDICGLPPSNFGSVPGPSGYDNYAR
ncbi:hypothetical protein EV421DRAFT_1900415 [Armillaria borealis]|uniref:Uncharacterized protein n=1 Tax=Armillaria borealis TaxID=47425 RepID=A0AA39JY27_9AGAR|nr:hypothetical protein EV421DRAFT_1900415 [Armillaria borealis]